MTTRTNDAVVSAQRRQASTWRQMTGTSPQTARTVEAAIARNGTDDPVFDLMARLCTHVAIEDTAFYEAAAIVAADVRKDVRAVLEALAALSDGPSAILLWSPESRGGLPELKELQELLDRINRARFARNNIAETVSSELVSQARAAALELASRLRSTSVVELPRRSELELVVEGVGSVAIQVSRWLGMRPLFEAQRFRDLALLRVLENADVFLQTLQERIVGSTRDSEAEAEALAVVSNLEAAAEVLVARREIFGNLLVLDASVEPEEANVVVEATLRPFPEEVRGNRVISGRVLEGPTSGQRRVELVPPGTWNDSEDFAQDIEVAHDENAFFFAEATPLTEVVASGTGSIEGQLFGPYGPGQDPSSPLWTPVGAPGSLPTGAEYAGTYAFVSVTSIDGDPAFSLYFSPDGFSWDLLQVESDPYGDRLLRADGFALGASASPGDIIEITRVSGSGFFSGGPRFVETTGRRFASTPYDDDFAVSITGSVTTATDVVVDWALLDPDSSTTTRVQIASGTVATEVPDQELRNQLVVVRYGTSTWTHRYILDIEDRFDGTRVLTFDTAVPTDQELTIYRFSNQVFPQSQYIRVRTLNGDRLDLRVGDRLVRTTGDVTTSYRVLHCIGDVAAVDRPLHTTAPYADVLAAGGARIRDNHPEYESESPWQFIGFRRYRGLELRDRIVALPVSSPSPGYSNPTGQEEYRIQELRQDAILCDVVGSESPEPLPRSYDRLAVVPKDLDSTTNLVQLVDAQDRVISVSGLDRIARRIRSAENPGVQLDDTFPLRSIVVILDGEPVDARRSSDTLIRLSRRVGLGSSGVPVRVSCRLDTESRRATLRIVDDDLRTGLSPSPGIDVSGAVLLDLGSGIPYGIRAGSFGSGSGVTDALFSNEVTSGIQGPIALGGPREYAAWAYVEYKLARLETPDLAELREDLGRALADLGTVGGRQFVGEVVEVVDPDAATIRIRFGSPPPTAGIVVGADVLVAGESSPPIRIVSVESPGTSAPSEVVATVTRAPGASVPVATVVRDSTIGQAWREIRAVTAYLDGVESLLEVLEVPEFQQISRIASQLDARGYSYAAEQVRVCNFSKWTDTFGLSNRTDLADRVEALVASVLTRRTAPLDT